ncbi:hypothetical protein SAMN06265348_103295 [Pedobacter westerhofensis]|uniref:Cell wall anchor protein n=2 Tax=Pedobacter westerhofensis TaxID=425512 RepID=A0A521C9X4_9SPHI|nr:hypothetical protein SAMN06265348_103295 [Pedobacter westerhofensis]
MLIILVILVSPGVYAQQTGSFKVGGDLDKFYPVTFLDGGWDQNIATELDLGRSAVHYDSDWRGSMIAKFRFHSNQWGNGANFIDADIFQIYNRLSVQTVEFVAGYKDATGNNNGYANIIWLRGGGTTYFFKSNVTTNPVVYDGIQNPLPYHEVGGPDQSYKTIVDAYVNSGGLSRQGTAYFSGTGKSYFMGNVGIGTTNPKEKLSVNGNIRAQEIKVESANWPDFVFEKGYYLTTLAETEKYIMDNGHLAGLPKAADVKANGINLGEVNKLLLQKIEELTLHLIQKDKEIKRLEKLNDRVNDLECKLNKLSEK